MGPDDGGEEVIRGRKLPFDCGVSAWVTDQIPGSRGPREGQLDSQVS